MYAIKTRDLVFVFYSKKLKKMYVFCKITKYITKLLFLLTLKIKINYKNNFLYNLVFS